jgi:SAM-dependent methyltransferase
LARKRLFISWGGDDAKEISDWLKEHIFSRVPQLDVYHSEDVAIGKEWRVELRRSLETATDCLGILTDVSLHRPWFMFEMSALYLKLPHLQILRFCPPPPSNHPLAAFQIADGFDFDKILQVATKLLQGIDPVAKQLALERIEQQAPDWALWSAKFHSDPGRAALRASIAEVTQALTAVVPYRHVRDNSCLWAVTAKYLKDTANTFRAWGDSREFNIDRSQYPAYLIHLLGLPSSTMAVAVVDKVEEFWSQTTGNEILKNTPRGSRRVFVFNDEPTLMRYLPAVFVHAQNYDVFVMSIYDFGQAAKPYGVTGDFSVVTDLSTNDQLTASYDGSSRYIRFATVPAVINRHASAFHAIVARAHPVRPPGHDDGGKYSQELARRVFWRSDDRLYHSNLVPIADYDAFEEDHPFYRDMHAQMLDEFRRLTKPTDATLTVLEIGAGTGHFTKRLSQQQFAGMEICAVEPDPQAVEYLERKFQKNDHIRVFSADFLTFDPAGDFHFIFSSFSEHHIKQEDQHSYFENIRRNLKPGGYFIIGDEFLPSHDPTNPFDYERALVTYHTFIIEQAKKQHNWGLVRLEELALNSGRPGAEGRLDFKTSVENYIASATRHGLDLVARHCVSSKEDPPLTGGMYVLVFARGADQAADH